MEFHIAKIFQFCSQIYKYFTKNVRIQNCIINSRNFLVLCSICQKYFQLVSKLFHKMQKFRCLTFSNQITNLQICSKLNLPKFDNCQNCAQNSNNFDICGSILAISSVLKSGLLVLSSNL